MLLTVAWSSTSRAEAVVVFSKLRNDALFQAVAVMIELCNMSIVSTSAKEILCTSRTFVPAGDRVGRPTDWVVPLLAKRNAMRWISVHVVLELYRLSENRVAMSAFRHEFVDSRYVGCMFLCFDFLGVTTV